MTEHPTINGPRLLGRLQELASISAGGPGVTRIAYSKEDIEARHLVGRWMEQAGLTVDVDSAANLIGRTAGASAGEPAIMLGSHLDTVPEGGRFDGAYGVLAAIEAADHLCRGPFVPSLAVVAFANEEGVVAPPGRSGSRAVAGVPPSPSLVIDSTGQTLGDLIAAAGGRPDEQADAGWPRSMLIAYLELHIEQGPVLHTAGIDIGVVETITARVVADIVVTGTSNHAGSTPMVGRHDALAAAAKVVLLIQRLAVNGTVRVATAGAIDAKPNTRNVIPGRVVIGIDLRDPDDARLAAAVRVLDNELKLIAAMTKTRLAMTVGTPVESAAMADSLMSTIEETARLLGHSSTRLPSGAGHDAQSLASLCPTAMIFVPSTDGISHAPEEHSTDGSLIAGADVLLNTVLTLDA